MLGLACGDAVGTTLEFMAPGTFALIQDMVGGGPFGLEAGQWTDDTSMALCLAESIVDTGRMDLADQLRRFLLWRNEGYLSSRGDCFDIGVTTSRQLERFARTGTAIDAEPDEAAAANGSLMRLAPVAVAWAGDVEQAAEASAASSRSTHAARRPTDACRLLGAMLAAFIGGLPAEQVLADGFWKWGDLHPEVEAIAWGSFRRKEPPDIRGTGYCIDALEAALWAVHGAADFRDAVLRAANLGDDAVTTAAIAGQLAGARWGASAIPAERRSKVAMGDRILSLADALLHQGGSVEPTRWPFDEAEHGWWAIPGQVLAGEYPARPDHDPVKLDILLDAGLRVFIDLTGPDDHLPSYDGVLRERAALRGLDVRYEHRPIPNQGTVDHDGYADIVRLIRVEMAARRRVFVHCWGGVGRTGTVVGCLLAEAGETVDQVVATIGALRAGTRKAKRPCPETAEQVAAIRDWCDALPA